MKEFFDGFLKFFAVLFAILFVATAVLALLLFNVEGRVFNEALYLTALEKQGFFERLPAILGETLGNSASLNPCETNPIACQLENRSPEATACFESVLGKEAYKALSSNQRTPTAGELQLAQPCIDQYPQAVEQAEGGPPAYLVNLDAADWEMFISTLLPPEDLKAMTEQGLASVFDYLDGETNAATVSLVALKERMAGPAGVQAAMTLMRAQPPCTLEQIAAMTASFVSGEIQITICNPSEELLAVIQPMIETQLDLVAAGIPDEATLISAPPPGAEDPLGGLKTVRFAMRLSPLIPLLFLVLIAIFAVGSLKGWLRWWGIPMLIAGLFGLIPAASASPLYRWAFDNFILERFPRGMPAVITDLARSVSAEIVSGIAAPILIQSLVLFLTGTGMVAVAHFYLKDRVAKT
ncbi:MAG: hypothetical protein ACOYZ8_16105 [Chloroflexota bacterium]